MKTFIFTHKNSDAVLTISTVSKEAAYEFIESNLLWWEHWRLSEEMEEEV